MAGANMNDDRQYIVQPTYQSDELFYEPNHSQTSNRDESLPVRSRNPFLQSPKFPVLASTWPNALPPMHRECQAPQAQRKASGHILACGDTCPADAFKGNFRQRTERLRIRAE